MSLKCIYLCIYRSPAIAFSDSSPGHLTSVTVNTEVFRKLDLLSVAMLHTLANLKHERTMQQTCFKVHSLHQTKNTSKAHSPTQ